MRERAAPIGALPVSRAFPAAYLAWVGTVIVLLSLLAVATAPPLGPPAPRRQRHMPAIGIAFGPTAPKASSPVESHPPRGTQRRPPLGFRAGKVEQRPAVRIGEQAEQADAAALADAHEPLVFVSTSESADVPSRTEYSSRASRTRGQPPVV